MKSLLLLLVLSSSALAQTDYRRKPIEYEKAAVSDAIYQLQQKIKAGEVELQWDKRRGWLPAVLQQLKVPISSQTLVFSKTSLQRHRISPTHPRALYYNDNVYVGYVQQGDLLEISAVDPHLGAVFYTIDQKNPEQPIISRDPGHCMSCHVSSRTQGVPGYLVRSVFPTITGEPNFRLGTKTTDHTTPIAERFGGWYVTGQHGAMRHRGNVITVEDGNQPIDVELGANRQELDELIDASAYLEPGSDLVALMVLEHQAQAHNYITKAAYQTRTAIFYDQAINRALDRSEGTISESSHGRIKSAGEDLLEYLLFSGEAKLTSPVQGSSKFTQEFAAMGPADQQGRSLREFDLKTRLFRYPCSFLIYSESIDALPAPMREYLRERLSEILSGEDQSKAFAHLTAEDRTAIREILFETKPERLVE